MITITSLTHPTMIAKVRAALKDAAMGKGHLRGGHANRVYVQNRKGHNILRIDYKGAANGGFIAYGGADWGQTVVTDIVKAALVRSNVEAVRQRHLAAMKAILCQDSYKMEHTKMYKGEKLVGYKARIAGTLGKLFGLGLIATTLTACEPEETVFDNAIYERVLLECLQTDSNLCDSYALRAAKIPVVRDKDGRLVRALKD